MIRISPILLVVLVTSCGAGNRTLGQQFTEAIGGSAVTLEMLPMPGDARQGLDSFWIGRTEVTWDLYDVFVYGLDRRDDDFGADAVTRPSKPYISMDRGFGHAGYPVISVSSHAAAAFCSWLSIKTGRRYRLPTIAEWRLACRRGRIDPAQLDRYAWYRDNAEFKTHPVATREPGARGLHDMYGNASEWCTGADGEPVTLGGSYRDELDGIGCVAGVASSVDWNRSDPQIPRSIWWLADAGFVGFRVVCEPARVNGGRP